jgi:sn-glycerol 3-phosphate transport system substrate-binding protein
MGGELGQKLDSMAKAFNQSQSDYEIVPVYKGTYSETMMAAIAAFRAHQQPAIVQVFEVGTATMMAAKGAIYPVYQLMADENESFRPADYLPAVVGYYTDASGHILSLPFNSSTPVMYYNKTAFQKAGLDPEKPPRTWADLADAGRKLRAAGYECGFTTGWQSWVQLENFSAWHNLPLGTKDDGFAGQDAKLLLNGPQQVRHIADMAEWAKSGIFVYGGRDDNAPPLFYNQKCAVLMTSSAGYSGIRDNVKDFNFGVAMLPYYPDIAGAPQNTIIGGASLWVLTGRPKAEYRGVAKFFSFLSRPEIQADWHQFSGYLPITRAAYDLTRQSGFYERNPGTEVAIREISNKPPTANSKGLRFGNFAQIRIILDNELEAVWAGQKTPQQALDDAVAAGNQVLADFDASHR